MKDLMFWSKECACIVAAAIASCGANAAQMLTT